MMQTADLRDGDDLTTRLGGYHNGSDRVIKQHVWGTQYVDELVQMALNDDPTDTEQNCETLYWVLQGAN